jgi:hypothetical protein
MFESEKLLEMWTMASYNLSQPLSLVADFGYQYVSSTWTPVRDLYSYWMSLGDPRVKDWMLMGSPWPTVGITLFYLYTCIWGPQHFMGNRKPLDVKPLILAYNFATSALNLYIGLELLLVSRQLNFSWTCQPVDYSNDPTALRIASALW